MAIYVTTPKKRGTGMTKPERLVRSYEKDADALNALIRQFPRSIYFTDDESDLGETTLDLEPYSSMEHQVWVRIPGAGNLGAALYAYRTRLGYSQARAWADAWNEAAPVDVPPTGAEFLVVKATTTYQVV